MASSRSVQPLLIRLHGGDKSMTYDENTGIYTWTFQSFFLGTTMIQLVEFDIPIPPDKSTRLFVRVPKITCVKDSEEGGSNDFCYMISLYKDGERMQNRAKCERFRNRNSCCYYG